jgi:hypothetical protein
VVLILSLFNASVLKEFFPQRRRYGVEKGRTKNMSKFEVRAALKSVMPCQAKHNLATEGTSCIEPLDETGESTEAKYELSDGRLAIARRLYRAMCAQYPDRLITLCDRDGRLLATSPRSRN